MAQILVVDDEVGIRELLSEILADEGHQVMLAESAGDARRVEVEPILRDELVGVAEGPVMEPVGGLPVERLRVGRERAREVAHGRGLGLHLRRVARGRRGGAELARRVEHERHESGARGMDVEGVGGSDHGFRRR